MKEKIKVCAYEMGLDLIGFCRPDMKELKLIKKERWAKNLACFFESSHVDVYEVMPEVKTVISVAMAYPMKSSKLKTKLISNSSWGMDYHIVLSKRINAFLEAVKGEVGDLKYVVLVDNHPLNDKYYAVKAGLGFIGKNNLLINEKYGSNIFLGTILINKYIKEDKVKSNLCKDCHKCLDSCPTKAINSSTYFNANKCRSYLTQKKNLKDSEEKEINLIYGCDICGLVCPLNRDNHYHHEFEPNENLLDELKKIDNLSNKEFKKKFNNYSFSWRGKKIIARNLKLIKKRNNLQV